MRRFAAARLLRSWVRIPLVAWLFVCCELSGRGLCDELITRPEESYRLWCVVVCDLETSIMRRPWPALGRSATKKYVYLANSMNNIFNKVFSGRQQLQGVKILQISGKWRRIQLQGVAGGLVEPKLKMGTEPNPETSGDIPRLNTAVSLRTFHWILWLWKCPDLCQYS